MVLRGVCARCGRTDAAVAAPLPVCAAAVADAVVTIGLTPLPCPCQQTPYVGGVGRGFRGILLLRTFSSCVSQCVTVCHSVCVCVCVCVCVFVCGNFVRV